MTRSSSRGGPSRPIRSLRRSQEHRSSASRCGVTAPTKLESLLRGRGIQRLVICGLATDYCVVETVLDARTLGFPVEVVQDAIRAVDLDPGDGDRAIARMRKAGAEIV